MNIDFSTLCLISVPGFIIGLMTGRFLAGGLWQSIKGRLGVLGKLLSGVIFLAYLGVAVIILVIMIIYIANLPETARLTNFWATLLFAVWIVLNLVFELWDMARSRKHARLSG